jgi:hypothetical protein
MSEVGTSRTNRRARVCPLLQLAGLGQALYPIFGGTADNGGFWREMARLRLTH